MSTPEVERLTDVIVELLPGQRELSERVARVVWRAEAEVKAEALREFAEYVTRVGEDGKCIRSETQGWWGDAHNDLRTILAMHDGWMGGRSAHDLLANVINDRADALSGAESHGGGFRADRSARAGEVPSRQPECPSGGPLPRGSRPWVDPYSTCPPVQPLRREGDEDTWGHGDGTSEGEVG